MPSPDPERTSLPGEQTDAAGLAALSLCESLLLSLTENGIIDAAAAHRGAAGGAAVHAEAAALLETILPDGNAVQRAGPAPVRNGDGSDPNAT